MAQKKVNAVIHSQEKLAEGIYSMWLDAPEMAKAAVPGQFIAVYTNDQSMEDFGSFTASRELEQRNFPHTRKAIPSILWDRWEMDSP